jgi:hypothetical protein
MVPTGHVLLGERSTGGNRICGKTRLAVASIRRQVGQVVSRPSSLGGHVTALAAESVLRDPERVVK